MDEAQQVQCREYECGYCLEVALTTDGPPERCGRCHMVACLKCGTFTKGDRPFLCHGCGELFPEVRARFCSIDSFVCAYMENDWARRNLGRGAPGGFCIGVGMGEDRGKIWLCQQVVKDGQCDSEHVRELTPDEAERYRRHQAGGRGGDDFCI